jgi:hypothetical protein
MPRPKSNPRVYRSNRVELEILPRTKRKGDEKKRGRDSLPAPAICRSNRLELEILPRTFFIDQCIIGCGSP